MNKNQIIKEIRKNGGAEAAALQQKFNMPYKEVKAIINELVADGALVFESGVKYTYVKKSVYKSDESKTEDLLEELDGNSMEDSGKERKLAYLRESFEERKRKFLSRRNTDLDEAKEDNEDDEDDDEDDGITDEELKYKALKLCIEQNTVSAQLFHDALPIGYIRAYELMDWMESMGYISPYESSKPRKVLITKAELDEIYDLDEEEDDDLDDLYNAPDLPDEEGEEASDINGKLNYLHAANEVDAESLEKAIDVLKDIIKKSEDFGSISEVFAQFFGERAALLIASDLSMSKAAAIKKAKLALEDVRKTGHAIMVSVYDRIVRELQNMSNYCYTKIRKILS